MARRAHRSSILSSSRTPDQLRVPRSEHLVHFSRRRCFEHNQRPEHLTCRRPRLDVARRAHPWPGTWCTYRRSQYERYSLAVTSDGKVGPSGVVLRPLSGPGGDNVTRRPGAVHPSPFGMGGACSNTRPGRGRNPYGQASSSRRPRRTRTRRRGVRAKAPAASRGAGGPRSRETPPPPPLPTTTTLPRATRDRRATSSPSTAPSALA